MIIKNVKNILEEALINNSEMREELYEYELEELLAELKASLAKDKNEFIFAITEHSGDIAMILIEKTEKVYINEPARKKLKTIWGSAYLENMKMLIPDISKQLNDNFIPTYGIKTV